MFDGIDNNFTKDSQNNKGASFNGASFGFGKIEKNSIQPREHIRLLVNI